MKKIFIFGFITVLFLSYNSAVFAAKQKEKLDIVNSIARLDVADFVMSQIKHERKEAPLILAPEEVVFINMLDLVISLLILFLVSWMVTGYKCLDIKKFLWVLISFNLFRTVFLLIARVVWEVIGEYVMKMETNELGVFLDQFALVLIVISILLYIWVLARTFNQKFFGALKIFFFSHLIYFLIIFLVFLIINPVEDSFFSIVRDNLGIKPVIRSYVLDIKKIAGFEGSWALFRLGFFHI